MERGQLAPATFDDLYRTYHARVVRLAARKFGESNADDIAQEAMLRAYRAFSTIDPARPVWPWLAMITCNAGIDQARSARRTLPTAVEVIEQLAPALPDQPASSAVGGDDRRRLARALQRLTDRDRDAIKLYELDGRPVAEVAALLGTTANTVRQRLFRARRHLAAEFEAAGGQPAIGTTLAQAVASWRPVRAVAEAARTVAALPGHAQDNAAIASGVVLALVLGTGAGATGAATAHRPAAGPDPSPRPTALVDRPAGPAARVVDLVPARRPELPLLGRVAGPRSRDVDWSDDCTVTRALTGCRTSAPASDSTGATVSRETVRSEDGTPLAAQVLLPAGRAAGDRHPVVLAVGPWVDGDLLAYPELWTRGGIFARGWAYVQVTLRGRGGSGGCADFGGPGEQADVRAAVAWAASQPWSSGRVGMWGVSYDGWSAAMALAAPPRGLAAAVVTAPVIDLAATLDSAGMARGTATWPQRHLADARAERANPVGLPEPCPPPAELSDPARAPAPYWRERDLSAGLARSTVPALWAHGWADEHAPSAPSVAAFAALRGPKRAFFGHFRHGALADDAQQDRWFTEAVDWLDHYVAGRAAPVRHGVATESSGGPDGGQRWREEAVWPPADAAGVDVPLLPGSWPDVPGNCADSECDAPVLTNCEELPGGVQQCGTGSWTFSQPLPEPVHVSGTVNLTVRRTPGRAAGVVALLYSVDDNGWAVLLGRGAAARAGADVTIALHPLDVVLPVGHRLALLLTAADSDWYLPRHTGAEVVVEAAGLRVPVLPVARPGATSPARFTTPLVRLPRDLDPADRTVHMPFPGRR